MEKVMVLLVGGRQFPNILGRLLLKPDRIEFIASKDELQKVKALSVIFNSVGSIKVSSTIYEICANDFEANKAAFKDICEKYKGEEIYLKEGKPLFNDVAVSLEIPSGFATKEIDVACIYKNQLIHCSCKSGKSPFKTSYLDELSAVSNLIGGRFCSRIFITNQMLDSELSQERQQWDLFREQANQRGIVIIKGDELAKAGDILKKQAINPDFSRV